MSEALKKAKKKYAKKLKCFRMDFKPDDKDIIDFLDKLQEPKAVFMRRIIRAEIERLSTKK